MSTLHHTETQIEVYKGNFFTSKLSGTRKNKHSPIVITFDLDETLVHSQFKPVENADIVLPVEIEG